MRKFLCRITVLLFIILLQQETSVVSQTQQEISIADKNLKSNLDVRPFTDLTFEIGLPARTLLPLQPIPIIIKQSNRTNQPVLGYNTIGFDKCPMFLEVQKSGSNEKKIIGQFSLKQSLTFYKQIPIPPGANYESRDWISMGLNIDFPDPGIYEITAVLMNENRDQFLNSNTVNIEIKQPTGVNRQVYNLIKNSSSEEYLFNGVFSNEVKNTLETINTIYPNSDYAKSSFYSLGELYFYRKQYPQALANLIRLENDGNFVMSEKVKKYLKEIRRLLIQIEPLKENQNQ